MSRSRTSTAESLRTRQRKTPVAKPDLLAGIYRHEAVLCLLLALATIALYSPAIGHSFVIYDDHDYITANPHIRDGLSWKTIGWAMTSTMAANWHPLTWLSHAFDYQLFGLNPAGHHFSSVLLHALNVVLVFLLLRWGTGRVGPSLLVAALFAVHPLNVESVAWVAERKNVLSTFFFLAAIGAYGWYALKPDGKRYLAVAALFVLGLMAKPMVITLSCVLLLLDYWPLGRMVGGASHGLAVMQRPIGKLVLEKIPLLCLSAASAVLTVKAQHAGYAVRTLGQFSLGARIENAIVAYGLYVWKMLWPERLALFYPHAGNALPVWQLIFCCLLLASISALVLALRSERFLLVGWLWFLGTLIPAIGLVQVGDAALADRYAYIPLIGLFIMIAYGLGDLAEARRMPKMWLAGSAACVLLALGFMTNRQLGYWESEYDLWRHTLAITQGNAFAENAMAGALLDPAAGMTAADLESVGTDENRMDEARRHYQQAFTIQRQLANESPYTYLPDLAMTLNRLGMLDRDQKRTEEARQCFEEALKIHRQLADEKRDPYLPDMAGVLLNLADVKRTQKQLEGSQQDAEEALRIYRQLAQQNPSEYLRFVASTLNNLGILAREQNLAEEASQDYEEALKTYRQLAPQDPDTYLPFIAGTLNNLGFLENREKHVEASRAHYGEALSIYQQLSVSDPNRYAADIARVERGLGQAGQSSSQGSMVTKSGNR
jgi:tetratricopeptide (TPR) repeat protein